MLAAHQVALLRPEHGTDPQRACENTHRAQDWAFLTRSWMDGQTDSLAALQGTSPLSTAAAAKLAKGDLVSKT